ncbi:MAG: LacI family DNA-binding transcriptional regulator [Planctomycetota bacterium]
MTLKELAERLALDVSTVSRALSGSQRVKEETRQRVLEAARALNYTPNFVARGLRSRTTRTVALVSGVLDVTVERKKLALVGDRLWHEGFHLFIGDTRDDKEREIQYVEGFLARRVDGMIVDPVEPEGPNQHLARLARERFPLVLCKRVPGLKAHTVYVDYASGAREAYDFLTKKRGRTRIAFFGRKTRFHEDGPEAVEKRFGLVFTADMVHLKSADIDAYRAGYAGVKEVLADAGRPRPDAIFCDDDRTAIGALLALAEAGVRVPQEMSVVGMDDLPASEFAAPPLTTVAQPKEDFGLKAAEVLLEAIVKGPSFEPVQIAMKPRLIVRASA